ncbi:hypothetical protein VTI74DRAFT_4329 [Chaetomium olivicolor]
MRPPRVAILVLFFSASLFLVFRSISSTRRPSAAATATTTQKSSFRALFSFTTPFSLFPPSAAISLTDDNSTFFPARPAAFGPSLPANGLSGQLWIGSGFSDDTLQDGEGEGELGCSDIPGWEDGRAKLTTASARQGSVSSNHGSVPAGPKTPAREELAKDPAKGQDIAEAMPSKDRLNPVDDGTDDYLHESLQQTRGHRSEGTTTSRSNHADIQSIQETAEITGKIALLSRGGCGFLEKVKWAQRRGAIALIVGDNQRGGPLIQMFARGNVDNVTIPSVFTSRTTAHLLSSLMEPGSFVEDILDENGNPTLSVQHPAKVVDDEKGMTPATSPAAPGKLAPRARKTGVARRTWFFGLFYRGAIPGTSSETSRLHSTARFARASGARSQSGKQDGAESNLVGRNAAVEHVQVGRPESSAGDAGDSSAYGSRKAESFAAPRHRPLARTLTGKNAAEDGEDVSPDKNRSSVKMKSASVHSLPGRYTAREGLWVTITPTGSASPFFDTLLVLVISPLITLTVVYALLILRVKIRMRRWRAPKSVVDRLPVRTYHTVAPSPSQSSRAPSPSSSSPTTPLLQSSSRSRPRSRTTTGVPETGDALMSDDTLQATRPPSHKKNSGSGSSQWKKYMGRQVECVVCLEEYIDGVSRVMSLPCGHEFHAECITPWLTTRRRTCPICKNDVVRSLARGSSSSPQYEPFREDDDDDSNDEGSDVDQNRAHSPDQIDDLERGPSWSQGSRRDWHSGRGDVWFSALTSRLGGSSSFSSRRDASAEDR